MCAWLGVWHQGEWLIIWGRWGDIAAETSQSETGIDLSSALYFVSLIVVPRGKRFARAVVACCAVVGSAEAAQR